MIGLESPTHALRADADPSAQSASATYITLAQEHPYDRHIEIILHLSGEQWQSGLGRSELFIAVIFFLFWLLNPSSEPHSPLVILERGRLSFSQYEQQICSRRDFIRCTRKDSEPERKVCLFFSCCQAFKYIFLKTLSFHCWFSFFACSWSLSGSDTTKTFCAAPCWCSISAPTCCVILWKCTKPPGSCCFSLIAVAAWVAPTSSVWKWAVVKSMQIKHEVQIWECIYMYMTLAPSCICFLILTGSHGGGTQESTFWHNAQHCGIWYHHQAPVHLQQALHWCQYYLVSFVRLGNSLNWAFLKDFQCFSWYLWIPSSKREHTEHLDDVFLNTKCHSVVQDYLFCFLLSNQAIGQFLGCLSSRVSGFIQTRGCKHKQSFHILLAIWWPFMHFHLGRTCPSISCSDSYVYPPCELRSF